MKTLSLRYLLPLLTALALPAHGAQFDEVLATLEAGSFSGGTEDFIEHVTWVGNPAPAHYACREAQGTGIQLELWQGTKNRALDRFGEQALKYGENGAVKVFALKSDNDRPQIAAYFMLPSGETWLFRLDFSSRGVTKDGKRFQCEMVAPTGE